MNPVTNPFTPGPGAHPQELIGRDKLVNLAQTCIDRARDGRVMRHLAFMGLRGVGKTVLLDRIQRDSEARGIATVRVNASDPRSLPALLLPELRKTLLKLRRNTAADDDSAQHAITRALGVLAAFAKSNKARFPDIAVAFDEAPIKQVADNGNLDFDLQELIAYASMAAKRANTALAVFIDEIQNIESTQLTAVVMAARRTHQRRLPMLLIAAGLPQAHARLRAAVPTVDYMLEISRVEPLRSEDARSLLMGAAKSAGAAFSDDALDAILARARGFPYLLHEWGKHAWNAAAASPISGSDVASAEEAVLAALDDGFYRVGLDRLTVAELGYLRAMASLDAEPLMSGEIARALGRPATSVSAIRSSLIEKGVVWSPRRGFTRFDAPLFGAFMCRLMPGDGWREKPRG